MDEILWKFVKNRCALRPFFIKINQNVEPCPRKTGNIPHIFS